jgi:hypothetical protein
MESLIRQVGQVIRGRVWITDFLIGDAPRM